MYYYGYCYPGFNASFGDLDDQSYCMGNDGLEIQSHAIIPDNGALLYYLPGFQPGYTPCSPISPGVTSVDGQYFGQQSYYPSPIFQQYLSSPGYFPQPVAYGPGLVPSYPWDSSYLYADGVQGNGYGGDSTSTTPKSTFSSQSHMLTSSKSLPSSKSTTSETNRSALLLDLPPTPAAPNQSFKPVNKAAAAAVFSNGYLPVNKIPSYANQGKGGMLYPNSRVNIKENGWVGTDKVKPRNKFHGVGGFDLLNEQNRGPRTSNSKNTSISVADSFGFPDAGKNDDRSTSIESVRKDMYNNLLDFQTKYDHAFFFVIKSYSEDDIHKSIKYNVWASTPNGNKRLDNAFQVAQEKMGEEGSKCPVFLFFSVNASGQFCGIAEMTGRVDFSKNMDFWQQDKWNGFFPVKWHIIKDIPNLQFRHIILENNENKPVTNSRDTQEVKFPQGTEMLNIFKNYSSKTSLLEDFGFYESRQKVMQDRRSKPPTINLDHLSPKTNELVRVTKPADLNPIISSLQAVEVVGGGQKKEDLPNEVAAKD